jgi:PAS domain-containing protein
MGEAMVESEKSAKELAPLLPLYNGELVRADNFLDIIIGNVPVGILITDTQGHILLANSVLGAFLGQQLVAGSDFASIGTLYLCHPGYTPADSADLPFLKFILEGKRIPGIDMMCSTSGGNRRDLLVNTPRLLATMTRVWE